MKKLRMLFGLLLSICSFSQQQCAYEELKIIQAPADIKIVKILEGKDSGLYGIVDKDGNFLTEGNNILISVQKNHIYLVDVDYNEGLMSVEGKWIGKMGEYQYKEKYTNMYSPLKAEKKKKFFIVYKKKGGRNVFGYLNLDGVLQIPFTYDDAEKFSEGLAAVKIGNKWGYIDENGTQVIPFLYDEASQFRHGSALVRDEDETFYIDKNGNEKLLKTFIKNIDEWIDRVKRHISSSFEEKIGVR